MNAGVIAQQRGLKISEQKETEVANYASLISLEVVATGGTVDVAGTVLRDETHIVRINQFWLDIVPAGGYFMLCYHTDKPGLIGAVGTITGKNNVNISAMQVARIEKRGEALMILTLDEPAGDDISRRYWRCRTSPASNWSNCNVSPQGKVKGRSIKAAALSLSF